MKHGVGLKGRIVRMVVVALAGVCWGQTAMATEDDMVPQGTWFQQLSYTQIAQTQGWGHDDKKHGLERYLLQDTNYAQFSGTVSRQISRADLTFRYGLSDAWNLSLNLPWLKLTQHSTLQALAPTPMNLAQVNSLSDQTLSGLGDMEGVSLHRLVFSDQSGLILGWGAALATAGHQNVRHGRTALRLGRPSSAPLALLHYTYYPYMTKARFDIRVHYLAPMMGKIRNLEGEEVTYFPGREASLTVGWRQEWGVFSYEVAARREVVTASRYAGKVWYQGGERQLGLLRLGLGNLSELEDGPLAFPFQLDLETSLAYAGNNQPLDKGYKLILQMFY